MRSRVALVAAAVALAGAWAVGAPMSHGQTTTTTTTTPASTTAPPFTQCPPVGDDTSCEILLVFQPDGTVAILTDPNQKPYDTSTGGGEDTLVGAYNASGHSVPSVALTSQTDAFGFEGDGPCGTTTNGGVPYNPAPAGCPFGPTGYEGPNTSFTNISSDTQSGTVVFGNGLAPGASAWFALEDAITATNLTVTGTGTATTTSTPTTTATTVVPTTTSPGPVASLVARPPAGPAPLQTSLDGSASHPQGGPPLSSWTLQFGDGSPTLTRAGLPTPIPHVYQQAGTYVALLTVTDAAGRSAAASAAINAGSAPPYPQYPQYPYPPYQPPQSPYPAYVAPPPVAGASGPPPSAPAPAAPPADLSTLAPEAPAAPTPSTRATSSRASTAAPAAPPAAAPAPATPAVPSTIAPPVTSPPAPPAPPEPRGTETLAAPMVGTRVEPGVSGTGAFFFLLFVVVVGYLSSRTARGASTYSPGGG